MSIESLSFSIKSIELFKKQVSKITESLKKGGFEVLGKRDSSFFWFVGLHAIAGNLQVCVLEVTVNDRLMRGSTFPPGWQMVQIPLCSYTAETDKVKALMELAL